MKLEQIVDNIRDILLESPHNSDIDIKTICCDSRKVTYGALYIAIKGTQFDGDSFIDAAIKHGAAAIVTESSLSLSVPILRVKNSYKALAQIAAIFYGTPAAGMDLIGITGTNGKSSTAFILDSILRSTGKKTGMIGTIANRYGDVEEASGLTTPDAISLQQLLCRMNKKGVKVVSMEVSSHALAQDRTGAMPFKTAIFTNLSQDHLDYHGDMDSYFRTKKKIFTKLLHKNGTAIINIDDPYGLKLMDTINPGQAISVGRNDNADFVISDIKDTATGSRFSMAQTTFETQLTGTFNIYNSALAVVAALEQGVERPQIVASLKKFTGVPGRLELFTSKSGLRVFVDYAHTADALKKALQALRAKADKLLCVFGCGGDRDKGKRPLMARAVEEIADEIWVTDDNPRTEDPSTIRKEVLQGFRFLKKIHEEGDRHKAIEAAIATMREHDILLVAGKGHEAYQTYGQTKIAFSDRHAVREILRKQCLV